MGISPRPRAGAAERILRATARVIVERGATALTMSDVAEDAGVSKGLIHYHFHDKETLLARLAEWMTRNLVARERAALAESTPRHAIDDLWGWLEGELERGHIRPLARNLAAATDLLEQSELAREYFGSDFVEHYVATRRWEVSEYDKAVTNWDRRRYLELI